MSSDGYLTFEDGEVRLGSQLLPGILVSQSIRGAVRYDEAKKDHMSGKNKVPRGWEDSTVTLTLDLLTDSAGDCYSKLAVIDKIFKGAQKANPKIYEVTGRHLRARGISRVVFDSLDSDESDQDDVIMATLRFVEHIPPVVKREKQAAAKKHLAASSGATTKTAPKTTVKPAAAPAVTSDTMNPLIAGFNAGRN